MLKDVLNDWRHRAQQENCGEQTGQRDKGRGSPREIVGRPLDIAHRSDSRHVEGVQLIDEAGELRLLVRRNSGDHRAQMRGPNVGNLNGTCDGIALA